MEYNNSVTLKDGRACTLRNGTASDGQALLDEFNLAHEQTDFLLTYPGEHSYTAEQEAAFLQEKTDSADEIELLAELDGEMERDKTIVAIIVSAVTFGVGHIVNLFTGQASFETVMQIIFAISWGFILTMVCYKGGSIIPCIIAHSMIDVLSLFGADNELIDWIYIGTTIVGAIAYCLYLSRIHSPESKGGVLAGTDA